MTTILTHAVLKARMLAPSADLLRSKIVAHRGWHRLTDLDTSRPLENTRQAYLDAASLGIPYAECDVWSTADGQAVLSHDSSLKRVAKERSQITDSPISTLTWKQIEEVRLKDGSTPVLLSTVLQDIAESQLRLVVELKSRQPVVAIVKFLITHSHLLPKIGSFISFNIDALVDFHEAFEKLAPTLDMPTMHWLVVNPRIPYDQSDTSSDELTFAYQHQTLRSFFDHYPKHAAIVTKLKLGLNFQYNSQLHIEALNEMRATLKDLHGDSSDKKTLFMWFDASMDGPADNAELISRFAPFLDGVGSDFPDHFFTS